MRKIIVSFILMLSIFMMGCPKASQQNVESGLRLSYTLTEQVRELNTQINNLHIEGKISKSDHDAIILKSKVVYEGVTYTTNAAESALQDLRNGVITEASAVKYLQLLISDEVIVPLNRYLVELRILSAEQAAILATIIQAVRAIAGEIIQTAKLQNVKVAEVS